MKPFLAVFILMLCLFKTRAQRAVPANYTGAVSFVRTWDATAPEIDGNTLTLRPLQDAKMTTQYADGIGRPLQTVLKQGALSTGAGTPTDVVMPVEYNALGQEQFKYLGYPESISADGSFKTNPFASQAIFMTAQYGSQGDTYFYGQTNFESSPLGRPENTFAVGNSWVGAGRSSAIKYLTNTALDAVRVWTVSNVAGDFGTYNSPGVYAPGTLLKSIVTDEVGNQVIEFKDKENKTLLKKVQINAGADLGSGSGHTGWQCTYYLYDDFNDLRCVIQPRGVELISPTWMLTNTEIMDAQCFRYAYDQRNRLIMKKVPGAGASWMVYDSRDRLVLSQDANMRNATVQHWLYTKYDELNRPVSTGLITDAAHYNDLAYHLNAAYSSTAYPDLSNYAGFEELTNTFYDNYNWLSSYTTGLTAGYNSSFDTYFEAPSNTVWPYAQANVASSLVNNEVTGSRVRILGSATFLYTMITYNTRGRVIQTQNTNKSGYADYVTTQYTWAGQPKITVAKVTGPSANVNVIVSKLTYDDLGRLVQTEKKVQNSLVNGNTMPPNYKIVSKNEYDKLGRLSNKHLGEVSGAALANMKFEYNIRGWSIGMNRDYITAVNNNGRQYFGYDLSYDRNPVYGTITPQYTGNISGALWKSEGDQEKRKYDFTYDAVNRLTGAAFNQYVSGAGTSAVFNTTTAHIDFSVSNLTYDANGNILTMWQKGVQVNTSDFIDKLKYNYENDAATHTIPLGNKLINVIDAQNNAQTKLGDFRASAFYQNNFPVKTDAATQDYSYDDNGNLTIDKNKNIRAITYNYLGLPEQINFYSGGRTRGGQLVDQGAILYTYDALGNKLEKFVGDNTLGDVGIATTTSYIGGAVYENDILQFIGQEEGRIRYKSDPAPALEYDYFLKDQLGNVRMVLTDGVQEDKYPVATMEDAKNGLEQQFYSIDNTKRVDKISVTGLPAYPNDNGIGNVPSDPTFEAAASNKLYRMKSDENKTGLGITLKVMAGDKINIYGKSFYNQLNTGGTGSNQAVPILDILTGFLGGPTGGTVTSGHGAVTATAINPPTGTGSINNMFMQQGTQSTGLPNNPKAFINYIFFDEQFNAKDFRVSMVGTSGVLTDHHADLQDIVVPKNGFVYIYCSNESPVNVYFDNLQVRHTHGVELEETHYYPFGLTMAGISSKAAGSIENKQGITSKEKQSKEFINGNGLEMYDFGFRMQDPQLGRWWQPDPLADKNHTTSPYAYCGNNPISYADPDGRDAILTITQDKNGNWNICISATYYVTGKDADKKWIKSEVKGLNNMLKETYADKTVDNGDGTTTTVSFDLKAEYKENISENNLKEGENIIEINNTDQPRRGNGRTVWDKRDKTPEEKPINKNDLAWIHTRHSYVNSHDWISTATHEIGHTLGLNDRYKGDTGNPHEGFENDLMGSGVYNLVPAHYVDWSQYGINQYNNNQQNKQVIVNYIDLNRRTAPKPKN